MCIRDSAQIVHNAADEAVDTGNIPRGHGRADEDQSSGEQRDHQAILDRFIEWIVAKGHTLDIVLQPHEGVAFGEGKRIKVNSGVGLERVDQNDEDRVEDVYKRQRRCLPAAYGL